MKLTLVLRDKKNALKLSTKTIESFMERIKSDTKDRTVGRRREQFRYTNNIDVSSRTCLVSRSVSPSTIQSIL